MLRLLAIVAAVLLAGCAAIEPAYVSAELEHISHVTQHEPFTSDPTEYGLNAAVLRAEWQPSSRLYLDVMDGATLNRCSGAGETAICGSLWGPREIFQAELGVKLWSR